MNAFAANLTLSGDGNGLRPTTRWRRSSPALIYDFKVKYLIQATFPPGRFVALSRRANNRWGNFPRYRPHKRLSDEN